jgi:nitrite reductase (NADH) large subunit
MAGGNALYEGTVLSNTLKVVGISLTASGEIDAERKLECVVRQDRENSVYRKVAFKEDKIVGCILLGNVKGSPEILSAIEKKVDVKDYKSLLLEEEFDFKKLL